MSSHGAAHAVPAASTSTTWRPTPTSHSLARSATDRLDKVINKVIEARCDLKRRQHPDYNRAGDSECEQYATDAEFDAWHAAHPEPADAEETARE